MKSNVQDADRIEAARKRRNAERLKQRLALPPVDEKQRYDVEEAALFLRTSRKSVFQLIASGAITSIKEGKRRYIPGSEIARLSSVPTAQA
jgi:hypothetical protein